MGAPTLRGFTSMTPNPQPFVWDVSQNGDMYAPNIWCAKCVKLVTAKLATDPRTGKHYGECGKCGANLGVSE
jgi:hypothetical protein